MTDPARTRWSRWPYALAIALAVLTGALLYRASDPLNSVEQGLVGVWKERTTRRAHDVLAFAPDRRYFVNDELTGTWRAVEGRLEVTAVSIEDVPLPLMLRLYLFVLRPFSTATSKPVVRAGMTRNGPDAITLSPEPGTDETTFDRLPETPLPEARLPQVTRFDSEPSEAGDAPL